MTPRPGSSDGDALQPFFPWMLTTFALLIRLIVIVETIGLSSPATSESASDSQIHIALVQSLLSNHGYSIGGMPTAITPPLYVFFLAGLYALFHGAVAVRLAQALLGAAGCLLLFKVVQKFFDRTTGVVAAVLFSVHPLVVYLTGLHLTESLFLFLLLLILVQSLRVEDRPTVLAAAGLGGLIGLASLTRAVFVGFLPFLFVWGVGLWGFRHPLTYRVFGMIVVSAALVILPWTIRNYLVLGAVVPIQSNAGMMFWAGNNPSADGTLVWPTRRTWVVGDPPDDQTYGLYGWRGLSVAADNRRYVEAALSWIRGHPRDYLRLLIRKLTHLYGLSRVGDQRDLHVPSVIMLFYGAFLVSALGGILLTIHHWRTFSIVLMLIIFTNAMTLLFSGGTRYTVPMIPSLILFSAAGATTIGRYIARAFGLPRLKPLVD